MPARELAKTEDIAQRRLIDAIHLRYHCDFRLCPPASRRRRLSAVLTRFQCKAFRRRRTVCSAKPKCAPACLTT